MLTRLFCDVDDCCHDFIPQWKTSQIENKERNEKESVGLLNSYLKY